MIRKRGNNWEVRTSDGEKLLGSHGSYKEAQAQLAAVEASKKREGK